MLGDLIKEAAEEYRNAPIGERIVSNSKWYDLFVNRIPQEMSEIYNKSNNPGNWIAKGSCGQGRVAVIPWCKIADPNESENTQSGIYVAYLFSQPIGKVYLVLGFGVGNRRIEYISQGLNWKEKISEDINQVKLLIPEEYKKEFKTDNSEVSLGNRGRASDYKAGIILYKEYSLNDFPENDVIENDYIKMIQAYKSYIEAFRCL